MISFSKSMKNIVMKLTGKTNMGKTNATLTDELSFVVYGPILEDCNKC